MQCLLLGCDYWNNGFISLTDGAPSVPYTSARGNFCSISVVSLTPSLLLAALLERVRLHDMEQEAILTGRACICKHSNIQVSDRNSCTRV